LGIGWNISTKKCSRLFTVLFYYRPSIGFGSTWICCKVKKTNLQISNEKFKIWNCEFFSAVVAEGNTQATYYTRSFQDLIESEDSDDSETEDSESSSCPEESSGSSDEEYSSSEDKKLNFEVQNEGIPTENLSSSSQCEVPYLEATDSLKNLKLA